MIFVNIKIYVFAVENDKEDFNMKIGYIGLGLMGGPLARNLIRAGKEVLIYDLSKEAIERTLMAGVSARVAHPEDMGDCDVIFTSLPLPINVREVMMCGTGPLNKMKKGSVYIDVSTIDPSTAEEIEAYANQRGIGFIAAPLGKGPAQAEKAEEGIFVGGDKDSYEKVLPLLEIVGSPICYLGGVKQAYAFKLITNMIGMTTLAVVSEGVHMAKQAGIDLTQFLHCVCETGGNSHQMQTRGPWIVANDFKNRFGVSLALKDVKLGCEMAGTWGYTARFAELAKEYYGKADQAGLGKEDCCAVYKVL